jgi:hypothetical protein
MPGIGHVCGVTGGEIWSQDIPMENCLMADAPALAAETLP